MLRHGCSERLRVPVLRTLVRQSVRSFLGPAPDWLRALGFLVGFLGSPAGFPTVWALTQKHFRSEVSIGCHVFDRFPWAPAELSTPWPYAETAGDPGVIPVVFWIREKGRVPGGRTRRVVGPHIFESFPGPPGPPRPFPPMRPRKSCQTAFMYPVRGRV